MSSGISRRRRASICHCGEPVQTASVPQTTWSAPRPFTRMPMSAAAKRGCTTVVWAKIWPSITVAHSHEAHFRVEQSTKSSRRAHLFPGSLARHPAPNTCKPKALIAHQGKSNCNVSHVAHALLLTPQEKLRQFREMH